MPRLAEGLKQEDDHDDSVYTGNTGKKKAVVPVTPALPTCVQWPCWLTDQIRAQFHEAVLKAEYIA